MQQYVYFTLLLLTFAHCSAPPQAHSPDTKSSLARNASSTGDGRVYVGNENFVQAVSQTQSSAESFLRIYDEATLYVTDTREADMVGGLAAYGTAIAALSSALFIQDTLDFDLHRPTYSGITIANAAIDSGTRDQLLEVYTNARRRIGDARTFPKNSRISEEAITTNVIEELTHPLRRIETSNGAVEWEAPLQSGRYLLGRFALKYLEFTGHVFLSAGTSALGGQLYAFHDAAYALLLNAALVFDPGRHLQGTARLVELLKLPRTCPMQKIPDSSHDLISHLRHELIALREPSTEQQGRMQLLAKATLASLSAAPASWVAEALLGAISTRLGNQVFGPQRRNLLDSPGNLNLLLKS